MLRLVEEPYDIIVYGAWNYHISSFVSTTRPPPLRSSFGGSSYSSMLLGSPLTIPRNVQPVSALMYCKAPQLIVVPDLMRLPLTTLRLGWDYCCAILYTQGHAVFFLCLSRRAIENTLAQIGCFVTMEGSDKDGPIQVCRLAPSYK